MVKHKRLHTTMPATCCGKCWSLSSCVAHNAGQARSSDDLLDHSMHEWKHVAERIRAAGVAASIPGFDEQGVCLYEPRG